MEQVNIKGIDSLQDYESTRNIVESTNDRKELEKLEMDVKRVIDRLVNPEDAFARDYLKQVHCYLWKRIEQKLFGLD